MSENVEPGPATRQVFNAVARAFPRWDASFTPRGEVLVRVDRTSLREVCGQLKDHPRLGMDLCHSLTAVDYIHEGRFELVIHLFRLADQARVVVKAEIPRDDPKLPTVSDVWPTAEWHEREAFDLLGIEFTGHPDLRRILLKDDFVGHPLRKDFVDDRPPRPRFVREDVARRREYPADAGESRVPVH